MSAHRRCSGCRYRLKDPGVAPGTDSTRTENRRTFPGSRTRRCSCPTCLRAHKCPGHTRRCSHRRPATLRHRSCHNHHRLRRRSRQRSSRCSSSRRPVTLLHTCCRSHRRRSNSLRRRSSGCRPAGSSRRPASHFRRWCRSRRRRGRRSCRRSSGCNMRPGYRSGPLSNPGCRNMRRSCPSHRSSRCCTSCPASPSRGWGSRRYTTRSRSPGAAGHHCRPGPGSPRRRRCTGPAGSPLASARRGVSRRPRVDATARRPSKRGCCRCSRRSGAGRCCRRRGTPRRCRRTSASCSRRSSASATSCRRGRTRPRRSRRRTSGWRTRCLRRSRWPWRSR